MAKSDIQELAFWAAWVFLTLAINLAYWSKRQRGEEKELFDVFIVIPLAIAIFKHRWARWQLLIAIALFVVTGL